MPRQDAETTRIRQAFELCQFNSRLVLDDLDLLDLLLEQETRRQDRPSERLVNAKEIVRRLKQYQKEVEYELRRSGNLVGG